MKLSLHHEHPWDLTPQAATRLQLELRAFVKHEPLMPDTLHLIGGVDASFTGSEVQAAVIVLDYNNLRLVDQAIARLQVSFPYIPGLLSFREAPAILAAMAGLNELPDVIIVDGHGYAHPRRFGLACHLGILLDLPTIGCAKSLLVGTIRRPLDISAGSVEVLNEDDEVLGAAVRTRKDVKPVYVSIGHRVDLPAAVSLVLACGRGFRLPEPTRWAHRLAGQVSL